MSRIIVKNLPNGIKEEKLKAIFADLDHITDLKLKFTKDGVFRKFAFIGFQSEGAATKAVKKFNQTFLNTNKLTVQVAADLLDDKKPRPWSKHSKQPEKEKHVDIQETQGKKSKKRDEKMKEFLGDVADDPQFEEFLMAHQSKSNKAVWTNDTVASKVSQDSGVSSSDSDAESEYETHEKATEEIVPVKKVKEKKVKKVKNKVAEKKGVSDLDYLKSKVTKTLHISDDSFDTDSDSSGTTTTRPSKKKGKVKKKKDVSSSSPSSSSTDSEDEKSPEKVTKTGKKKVQASVSPSKDVDHKESSQVEISEDSQIIKKYFIKMKGSGPNTKVKQVREFFSPLCVKDVQFPLDAKGKPIGVTVIEFENEKDMDQASRKNKNFLGGKRVYLKKSIQEVKQKVEELKPWEAKVMKQKSEGKYEEAEPIGESGRLYIRNLSYTCTEEDIEKLFKPFGPLTEIHLPIDTFTKKIKGFAFVTYMMPEHAVKAFTKLDGISFQGRLLHILAAKPKKESEDTGGEGSSFKKKKHADMKSSAGRQHNWNALFLGANVVADVMAEKYGKSKSEILDNDTNNSLAVRLALGETQIVSETRQFLIDNGVSLDAFSQPAAQRSKTCILVKNLPAGTTAQELEEVFSKHGSLGRVVMPPSGITGIVEYLESAEAKFAFKKLAYTRFQHVPLYLEWAPMEVFDKSAPPLEERKPLQAMDTKTESMDAETVGQKDADENIASDSENETIPETTLFIKNISFETKEESLKKVFKKAGKLKEVTISKKKDPKNPGGLLSMGYGFVVYKDKESARKALKELQHTVLDGHALELKMSHRVTKSVKASRKKKQVETQNVSTKILIRNVPFEAKTSEVLQLFRVFGEIKSCRLPKKLTGTGSHRGFGFVEFLTKNDAKRAFEALCHSTHLYGRRLVLEWADTDESVDHLRKKTAEHFHEGEPNKKLRKIDLKNQLEKGGERSDDF